MTCKLVFQQNTAFHCLCMYSHISHIYAFTSAKSKTKPYAHMTFSTYEINPKKILEPWAQFVFPMAVT